MEENKTKPKIGQKVFVVSSGRYSPSEIIEKEVTDVGNKYFYLNGDKTHKIGIDNWRYENKMYSQHSFQVYEFEQQIKDEQEHRILRENIRKAFDYISPTKYTLEQLRAVWDIINPTPNNK